MSMEYCSMCGKYHEITTSVGCEQPRVNIPMVYPNNYQPSKEQTIERKLDRIITILEEIEYYLRKQNNK